jgi:hypothetical protein
MEKLARADVRPMERGGEQDTDQARQRAEKRFKKEQCAQDGRAAVTEYEAEARATREKTASLKAVRLAKEAEIVIAL